MAHLYIEIKKPSFSFVSDSIGENSLAGYLFALQLVFTDKLLTENNFSFRVGSNYWSLDQIREFLSSYVVFDRIATENLARYVVDPGYYGFWIRQTLNKYRLLQFQSLDLVASFIEIFQVLKLKFPTEKSLNFQNFVKGLPFSCDENYQVTYYNIAGFDLPSLQSESEEQKVDIFPFYNAVENSIEATLDDFLE